MLSIGYPEVNSVCIDSAYPLETGILLSNVLLGGGKWYVLNKA